MVECFYSGGADTVPIDCVGDHSVVVLLLIEIDSVASVVVQGSRE